MQKVQPAGNIGVQELAESNEKIPGALDGTATGDSGQNFTDSSSVFGDRVDDAPALPQRSARSTAGVTSRFHGSAWKTNAA